MVSGKVRNNDVPMLLIHLLMLFPHSA